MVGGSGERAGVGRHSGWGWPGLLPPLQTPPHQGSRGEEAGETPFGDLVTGSRSSGKGLLLTSGAGAPLTTSLKGGLVGCCSSCQPTEAGPSSAASPKGRGWSGKSQPEHLAQWF